MASRWTVSTSPDRRDFACLSDDDWNHRVAVVTFNEEFSGSGSRFSLRYSSISLPKHVEGTEITLKGNQVYPSPENRVAARGVGTHRVDGVCL